MADLSHLTPEQQLARTARRIRRSLRRLIAARRSPEFMARLQHRLIDDKPVLDRLKDSP